MWFNYCNCKEVGLKTAGVVQFLNKEWHAQAILKIYPMSVVQTVSSQVQREHMINNKKVKDDSLCMCHHNV